MPVASTNERPYPLDADAMTPLHSHKVLTFSTIGAITYVFAWYANRRCAGKSTCDGTRYGRSLNWTTTRDCRCRKPNRMRSVPVSQLLSPRHTIHTRLWPVYPQENRQQQRNHKKHITYWVDRGVCGAAVYLWAYLIVYYRLDTGTMLMIRRLRR